MKEILSEIPRLSHVDNPHRNSFEEVGQIHIKQTVLVRFPPTQYALMSMDSPIPLPEACTNLDSLRHSGATGEERSSVEKEEEAEEEEKVGVVVVVVVVEEEEKEEEGERGGWGTVILHRAEEVEDGDVVTVRGQSSDCSKCD